MRLIPWKRKQLGSSIKGKIKIYKKVTNTLRCRELINYTISKIKMQKWYLKLFSQHFSSKFCKWFRYLRPKRNKYRFLWDCLQFHWKYVSWSFYQRPLMGSAISHVSYMQIFTHIIGSTRFSLNYRSRKSLRQPHNILGFLKTFIPLSNSSLYRILSQRSCPLIFI